MCPFYLLSDRKHTRFISQAVWMEFLSKKPMWHPLSDRQSTFLSFLGCRIIAFTPRGSNPLAVRGSRCSIFCNIGPCFLLCTPALSLPLSLPYLPLTSIFFSVVVSLVLRAEINCFSSLRAYILLSHVGTFKSVLYPWGWRRGFH